MTPEDLQQFLLDRKQHPAYADICKHWLNWAGWLNHQGLSSQYNELAALFSALMEDMEKTASFRKFVQHALSGPEATERLIDLLAASGQGRHLDLSVLTRLAA